jgi:hypothetical protein
VTEQHRRHRVAARWRLPHRATQQSGGRLARLQRSTPSECRNHAAFDEVKVAEGLSRSQ